MKVVIDIPEENYKKDNLIHFFGVYSVKLDEVIKNGTPLPKGHGALKDTDALCNHFWDNRSKLYTYKDLQIVIDRAPTIIEADKENK